MNALLLLEAGADAESASPLQDFIPRDPGVLILLAALVAVTLGVFIWAAFFRKTSPRRHHHHHHRSRIPGSDPAADTEPAPGRFLFVFPRRRRHRRYRTQHRNPTLAEGGGLPPVRNDDSTQTPG